MKGGIMLLTRWRVGERFSFCYSIEASFCRAGELADNWINWHGGKSLRRFTNFNCGEGGEVCKFTRFEFEFGVVPSNKLYSEGKIEPGIFVISVEMEWFLFLKTERNLRGGFFFIPVRSDYISLLNRKRREWILCGGEIIRWIFFPFFKIKSIKNGFLSSRVKIIVVRRYRTRRVEVGHCRVGIN